MTKINTGMLALGTLLAGCTTNYAIQPQAIAEQTVRYDRGAHHIRRQVSGHGADDSVGRGTGRALVFGMAVFNKGAASMNFGVENVAALDGTKVALKTYTKDELAGEARTARAFRAVAAVLAGAAAAYSAQQNAYRETNGSIMTSNGGSSRPIPRRHDDPTAAAIGTAAAGAATGYTLASIKNSMDATLDHLNGAIRKPPPSIRAGLTAARSLSTCPRARNFKRIEIETNLNGEAYEFDFSVSPTK